jgi:sulfite exporter TauE/SafE/copper chaperone CopZ
MIKIYYINGMHCASCEDILEKELSSVDGVNVIRVSYNSSSVDLDVSDDVSEEAIHNAVKKCGLKICERRDVLNGERLKINNFKDYLEMFAIAVVAVDMILVVNDVGVNEYFPKIAGITVVFISLVLGFVSSISKSISHLGKIVVSISSISVSDLERLDARIESAMPQIYFQAGRILFFSLFGGFLGLLGRQIIYLSSLTVYVTAFSFIVIIYLGFWMLRVFPGVGKVRCISPTKITKKINDIWMQKGNMDPVFLGGLTFFLPCVFMQSMQIIAFISGSFICGALIMGVFALGTLPSLISISRGAAYTKKPEFVFVNRVLGIIVILTALYSLILGVISMGFNMPNEIASLSIFNRKIGCNSASSTNVKNQKSAPNNELASVQITESGLSAVEDK